MKPGLLLERDGEGKNQKAPIEGIETQATKGRAQRPQIVRIKKPLSRGLKLPQRMRTTRLHDP